MRQDRLDRWATMGVALSTMATKTPFWCTLTPPECRTPRRYGINAKAYYLSHAEDRRALRAHVRALCAGELPRSLMKGAEAAS